MSKELYMDEVQRIMDDLIAHGMYEDYAYEIASERAYPAMRERLFDMADMARKKERGE